MPKGVVKPGEEGLWNKAKAVAAKEGHKEDWAYINGIFQRMKGKKEAMYKEALEMFLNVDRERREELPQSRTKRSSKNIEAPENNLTNTLHSMMLEARPIPGQQNVKVAGVLDTLARKGPSSLRPLLQKLVIMFKYPEYHAQISRAHSFKRLLGSQRRNVIKDLLKNNKSLYKRMLESEGRLYGGKGVENALMRQTEVPSNRDIMQMIGGPM